MCRYYGIDPVFNYGFFPQTWEDPNVKHSDADCLGDGDPIDVVVNPRPLTPSPKPETLDPKREMLKAQGSRA
jgi:hypothetical protein